MRRKLAHHVAVECHIVHHPEAVEDREQQKWILGRLSERFRLFDQQTCSLRSRLSLLRGISFDMHMRGCERHLKLDSLAGDGWHARQRGIIISCRGELLERIYQPC